MSGEESTMEDGRTVQGRELLTLPEAAAILRIRLSTLRDWILNRRISYVKVGRLVRIRRVDIDALISTRTVPAQVGTEKAA
jgi:excisionase family DNA binding protein